MYRRTLLQSAALGGVSPLLDSLRAATDPLSWEAVMAHPWSAPAKLQSFAGKRPRLFLSPGRIASLQRKVSGSHREVWAIVKENADSYLGKMPPSNFNSQGDMRAAGRGIPWQALAFRITGDSAYLEGARKWVLTICEYPRWEQNNSLSGGECLFGVSIGYDWLYDRFEPAERKRIKDKLVHQARALKTKPVHHDRWLANHNHVEHLGLAAAGFALFDELPEAVDWIRQSHLVFLTMLRISGSDGASTEGHQYWAYTVEGFLRYAELARELLGEDMYRHEWVRAVPEFIIHSTLPGFSAENCVMSFGDSHREYSSHGPTHILYRTAAEYRNGHAQWLAQEMQKRRIGRDAYCTWANLLWYDETLAPVPVGDLPLFKHYEDVGWVTARSSWADDAVMVGFKCGPMHGYKAERYYMANRGVAHEIGGGHGHPDVNSFQVFARGKWLAIDPGYERPKWTRTHNPVLINGKGQLGESKTWFDRDTVLAARATSAILKAEHNRVFDYIVGDAKNIYPRETGLGLFRRHFIYMRPDFIVIADELRADSPAVFEWLLHSESGLLQAGEGQFVTKNGGVEMDVQFLAPAGLQSRIREKTLIAATPQTREALIIAVLHPRSGEAPRVAVDPVMIRTPRIELALRSADRRMRIVVDLASQKVSVRSL